MSFRRDLGWLLAAETLGLPAGFLLWIFLTRRLGPQEFGPFTVTVSIIGWIELSMVAFLGRTTVRALARTREWRAAAACMLRAGLTSGLGIALLVALGGTLAAISLQQPYLSWTLPLLALEIPLLVLAEVHRSILVAQGSNVYVGWVGSVRWMARLGLMAGLVELGFGLAGALAGSVIATGLELLAARLGSGAALSAKPDDGISLLKEVTPWVASTIGLRLLDSMGVWAALFGGCSAATLGLYGAAQGATRAAYVILTLMPPLHAELIANFRDENLMAARRTISAALGMLLALLPVPLAVAATAPKLVALLFGAPYADSAPFLSVLMLGTYGLVLVDAVHTILAASGHPTLTLRLTAPMLPAALLGHLLVIPVLGALGAAVVTAACLLGGAIAGVSMVSGALVVPWPGLALGRGLLLGTLAALALAAWPLAGWKLMVELALVTGATAGVALWSARTDRLPA